MKPPIVLSAFGTSSKALDTYSFIDSIIKARFAGHEVVWAYTSRMIKQKLAQESNVQIKHPDAVLKKLYEKGHKRAVVQSMHLICGHEFYKLTDEARSAKIHTSIGMPLLTSCNDYKNVSLALSIDEYLQENEAVVLVGHGTQHHAWTSYPALENILKQNYGPDVHIGVIDTKFPKIHLIEKIDRTGAKQIILLPFMLVAGMHLKRDLTGSEDSWQNAFNAKNIFVKIEKQGIGYNKKIIEIFINHIQGALDRVL